MTAKTANVAGYMQWLFRLWEMIVLKTISVLMYLPVLPLTTYTNY